MTLKESTNYSALAEGIDGLVEEASCCNYENCVTLLARRMRECFPALTEDRNPVCIGLASWDAAVLRFVIREYSAFTNAAIHMFLDARIRNHWPSLTAEIVHNMDEEMGALTGGVPHLELMHHGYRMELGIETDDVAPSSVTREFIDRMNRLFRDRDNTFLAGALLAFETTAVDEFRVVDRLLRQYRTLQGGEIQDGSLTGKYIAGHVVTGGDDPEEAHYRGMVDAVGAHVVGKDMAILARGFYAVCFELNLWWEGLAAQAIHERVRERLMVPRQPAPDIYASLVQVVTA
jgi:hypothetical protein